MKKHKVKKRNPWAWIPTLYFAEGIPYVVVMLVSVIMYKRMGISNTDIALYTSWLYLPWVIKPLWSPLVDIFKTKRYWIVIMQLLVGAGLAGVALTIPLPGFFRYTLAFFWLLAFSSATHDVAADGFYMLGLSKHDQAWFVGVRSTFYRVAMITGQGLLIIFAGYIESHTGLPTVPVNVQTEISSPVSSNQLFIPPDSISVKSESGALHILTYPSKLEINTQNQPKARIDSIKAMAKTWNTDHGFYSLNRQKGATTQSSNTQSSWWEQKVVANLDSFIKKHFGQKKISLKKGDKAGNVGVVYFYLSHKPQAGKSVTINFGRDKGDKSIKLVEGEHFRFNTSNWNMPAMAVIQLDPKLKTPSRASFDAKAGNIPLAWTITFFILAGMFVFFFLYHRFILPYPDSDKSVVTDSSKQVIKEFFETFKLFFQKENIGLILAFLLLYRLGEAQLVKLASPFLLDAQEAGGLALTTGQVGFVYGTIGILALTVGGLLGGFVAARDGLKRWLWWMVIAMNLPNAVYIYLSMTMPHSILIINVCVAIEQFGYGFGFTAYMLYMIYVSEGDHKTAHFAITTGFMALGMMLPGMLSGWIEDLIGYQHFFIWVMIATLPAFIITKFIPLDPEFGKKKEQDDLEAVE
jgi:PAT family beta-lactamase induction signal transducer AmpG